MPRNLYKRVELLTPVTEEALKDQLSDVLDRSFADNTNSWRLQPDGLWSRRTPNGSEPRNLQRELMKVHAARSEEATPAGI
jgi:polyphosphate kinase